MGAFIVQEWAIIPIFLVASHLAFILFLVSSHGFLGKYLMLSLYGDVFLISLHVGADV